MRSWGPFLGSPCIPWGRLFPPLKPYNMYKRVQSTTESLFQNRYLFHSYVPSKHRVLTFAWIGLSKTGKCLIYGLYIFLNRPIDGVWKLLQNSFTSLKLLSVYNSVPLLWPVSVFNFHLSLTPLHSVPALSSWPWPWAFSQMVLSSFLPTGANMTPTIPGYLKW